MISRSLIAAAGNAGGESLYVEDVFSTYLYKGTGIPRAITNGIDLGSSIGGGGSTNLDFSSNEYVYRDTALTGAADVKTFTLSAWIYPTQSASDKVIYYVGQGTTAANLNGLLITLDSSQNLDVAATNAANTTILNGKGSTPLALHSWNHILVSIDLSSTGTRKIYINDVDATSGYSWLTYTNDSINFTVASNRVGRRYDSSALQYGGNVASVFLAHTYTDLTVQANRRKFIDSEGAATTHATVSALSPIVYLPLDDDYASGTNLGTGGSFTSTGSFVATGPNYTESDSEGGMVWIKSRSSANTGSIFDTERGATGNLRPSSAATEYTTAATADFKSFDNSGFSVNGSVEYADVNISNSQLASWTFRKAEKFFDFVTYTGTGSATTFAHALGSVPAVIMVKRTDVAASWQVYHKDLTSNVYKMVLDTTAAEVSDSTAWNSTTPTDAVFSVGTNATVNASGGSYVAYLFASDAGGFGDTGSESIIKCGSYTGTGATGNNVTLGFEPQWLMIRAADRVQDWFMFDDMRGMTAAGGIEEYLLANSGAAGSSAAFGINPTATGFDVNTTGTSFNASGENYIYIAIRRPMKTPESGTEVFTPAIGTTDYDGPQFDATFSSVDLILEAFTTSGVFAWIDRVRGELKRLRSSNTDAEVNSDIPLDLMYGAGNGGSVYDRAWMFKRAPGFMDVVAYTSTTSAINHNLGVSPELVIYKSRTTGTWFVMAAVDGFGELNGSGAFAGTGNGSGLGINLANATATTITGAGNLYGNGVSMVTYLFASVAGVSKVGSYTGTGSDLNVDCGFSAGARFVLIKRTDSSGDWYVWDTARGIVAGNDPYLLLNSTGAEATATDYIDPLSSGFTVTSSAPAALNASGGTYIYLAIA